jgi:hypothetical protein
MPVNAHRSGQKFPLGDELCGFGFRRNAVIQSWLPRI